MKIVIAPDSFKDALSAPEVAQAIADGWREIRPNDKLICVPLADGGEGTCRALTAALNGTVFQRTVAGPLGEKTEAEFGISDSGQLGIFEMASASGIELVDSCQRDPGKTSTFGTGELLLHILKFPVKTILMGIGGSATVDGGAGMLQALGARYYDCTGTLLPDGLGGGDLSRIAKVDLSRLPSRLGEINLEIACDVDNPLLGENGAAAVFGPQKGAVGKQISMLEEGLKHWSDLLTSMGFAPPDQPGDGAAGGLGYLLRSVCHAEIRSGAELVMKFAKLDDALDGADLFITGEGCSDEQTLHGKLCSAAAAHAAKYHVASILCSGALRGGDAALAEAFAAIFSISSGPGSLEKAIQNSRIGLFRMGRNLASLLGIGEGCFRRR